MDVSSISSSQASQAQGSSETQVANQVQKKAMEIAEQTASQLIEAIPDPSSPVGQNIDISV